MDIVIRRAGQDDLQTIHEMAEVVFRETYKTILSADQMDYMMDWMYSIYVMPSAQGTGLGHRLLETAKQHVRDCKWSANARIELNVNRNNPAVGFYRNQGLSILRQGDFPIGNGFYMNDYIMGTDIR